MGKCIGTRLLRRTGLGALHFINRLFHSGNLIDSIRRTARLRRQFKMQFAVSWRLVSVAVGIVTLAFLSLYAKGAETNEQPSNVVEHPGPADTNLLGSFRIKQGFRIEVAASEPMVLAPVAMAFDENGRLFVVEMRGRDRRGANLGRVRMLENLNEDGVFQNSTIYADNLTWPSAIACYAGGIFVAAAPDIIYFKDTKGDGVADAHQVVLTGLGGANSFDPDSLPNSFNWGPDNRIHAASGGVGGELAPQENASSSVSIARCDFSFDPRTLEAFPEAGPAQSGLSFDSRGRKFVSDFVRPVLLPMYDLRYTSRNPYYPKPSPFSLVADPRAPLYRFVSVSTNAFTGAPVTNVVAPGPSAKARGLVVYRGLAFPTNYFDNVFVADSEAHVVRRLELRENGLEYSAQRLADEPNTEFLISTDPAFRPVQLINGPDGALYIADQQQADDRGRIYRILPSKFKRPKSPQLGKLKTYDLVSTLAQGAGWHRDTAARLLYERSDTAAVPLLRGTLGRSRLAQARVLALSALAGAGALSEDDVTKALNDTDARVREQGLLAAEKLFKNGDAPAPILTQLGALAADPSPRVRYQLAFTMGELQRVEKVAPLAQILARNGNDIWFQNAVLSSTATGAGGLFNVLANDARFRNDPVGMQFLQQLATSIGVSGHQDVVTQAASVIARSNWDPAQVYMLLYRIGDGLHRTRSSLGLVDPQGLLQPIYSGALNFATDTTQPEVARAAAVRLLSVSTYDAASIANWLFIVCFPPSGPIVQSAAVDALSRYEDPRLFSGLLDSWTILTPIARVRAVNALLSRDSQVPLVVDAIQSGKIPALGLTSAQRNFLRTHRLSDVSSRAIRLLGPVPVARPEVMEKFKQSVTQRGNVDRGRNIFLQRCAECHAAANQSAITSFGPPLFHARTFTRQQLLSSIVEPNVAVRPDYATTVVESNEGQSLLGIVLDENPTSVTLKQLGDETVVWARLNIRSIRPQSWSLMPDGLEPGFSTQDMSDLMEYVLNGTK
jgi:putative membrane-bound dehydrogenase-like protein